MLGQCAKGYFIPLGRMSSCNRSHWKEDKAHWRLFPAAVSPKATFSWFQTIPLLLQEEGRWKCEEWLSTWPHSTQLIWYQAPGLHLVQWGVIRVCLGRHTHFLLLSSVTHSSPDFFFCRKVYLRDNWYYSRTIVPVFASLKKVFDLFPVFQSICFQCNKKSHVAFCTRCLFQIGRKPGYYTKWTSARYVCGLYWKKKNLNLSLKKLLYSPI